MSEPRTLTAITQDGEFFRRTADLAMRVTSELDSSEVSAVLAEASDLCGADAAAFASFVKDDEAYVSYRFILACDPTWCLEYESNACYMHDPWWDYTRHHSEATLAKHIPVRTAQQNEVVALARRFGFASAILIPAQSPQGLTRLGALCLGSAKPEYLDEQTLTAVSVAVTGLVVRLHAWQIAKLRDELVTRTKLSQDDLALLAQQRQGRSSKEIASLMNMTSQGVDSRWQRLNAKLGVSSRTTAAQLAAEYGLI
ncbi:helix-turn-helix transcriptional regulator [Aquabacterium sp. J223]|uniref:helix-turn-helix transcriptional regulator n=1 Tax=Aquabacterium sp. J223 TaxID=2898431 RepID=UPI0021AE03B9|nr:autoinducer binding domain-containing protein [Aquabacterium sp. J223]UUX97309.1 autoinducer binding domain-containing protein [Aquabacterium sp. J223]